MRLLSNLAEVAVPAQAVLEAARTCDAVLEAPIVPPRPTGCRAAHGSTNLLVLDRSIEADRDVRFTPESGHKAVREKCPLRANSGHSAIHSITS